MTACRPLSVLVLVAALALGGCGGNGGAIAPDETSDGTYQQAQQLKREGRNGEALAAFLKEIDRRGESGAPESHLEAGNLYLNYAHDPYEAYHHFSKYLELQPNGTRSEMVRGQREAAKREIARTLLGATNDPAVRVNTGDDIDAMQRRIRELEAENKALGGTGPASTAAGLGGGVPASGLVGGARVPTISLDDQPAEPANNASTVAPVPMAPPRATESRSPATSRPGGGAAPMLSLSSTPAPVERPAATASRPVAPTRPGAAAPAAGRRTHTITAADKSLWGVARKYYGAHVSRAQVDAIVAANRDVLPSANAPLRPGMVLRIP